MLRLVAVAVALALPACGWLRHERAAAPSPVEAIDLNSASLRKVEGLPGVTPSMARRIVEGRPYASPDDLVTRGILTRRELERISDRITVNAGR